MAATYNPKKMWIVAAIFFLPLVFLHSQVQASSVVIIAKPSAKVTIGDLVTLEAKVSGATPPFRYVWYGDCDGGDKNVNFAASKVKTTCGVNVYDAAGRKLSASAVVYAEKLEQQEVTTEEDEVEVEVPVSLPTSGPLDLENLYVARDSNTMTDGILGESDCQELQVKGVVGFEEGAEKANFTMWLFELMSDQKVFLRPLATDYGEVSLELCAGQYLVEIDTDSLGYEYTVGGGISQREFTVSDTTSPNSSVFNFIITPNLNQQVSTSPIVIGLAVFAGISVFLVVLGLRKASSDKSRIKSQ